MIESASCPTTFCSTFLTDLMSAKTSILSRRWSQLSAKLPRLIINPLPEGEAVSRANISHGHLVRLNAAAFKATKSLLARREPGQDTIRLLSTSFYLIGDVPISIGHAVGEAMAVHKIEKAEFRVLTVKGRDQCRTDDLMDYGKQFLSFFNECRYAFTGLTRLYLENLRFAKSDLLNIFVTCKLLKYLGFFNCERDRPITLQIEHAQLSELSLVNCRFDKVELKWLPRLTWATYKFWIFFELPLSFGHVPLLEFLHLTNIAFPAHKMVSLSTLLSETCVQDLRLGFRCEKIWVQPESLTQRLAAAFRGLRIVNLVGIPEGHDLTWTMFILEAAPCLEEFYMSVMDHPCEMQMNKEWRSQLLYSENNKGVVWESPRSDFKHCRLTKLIIFCFGNYIESHLRRVMKAAVNLKDVYLYDRVACRCCEHINPLNPGRLPRNKKLNAMKNLLTQGIESPARIHFLIPSPEMDTDHAERLPESFSLKDCS